MAAKILDGNTLAKKILLGLREKIKHSSTTPTLGIILVGNSPNSLTYVKKKQEAAAIIGARILLQHFPEDINESEIAKIIRKWNHDSTIQGIIIQLPLPGHLQGVKIEEHADLKKDVDGLVPGSPFTPATAKAVELILDAEHIEVGGKYAVVVGRSRLVGLPIAKLLLQRDATVTIAHSKTNNLKKYSREADILVVAAGQPNLISRDAVKDQAIVFNIGITMEESEKLVGDVNPNVTAKVSFYTPTPGGIGPLTVAALMTNLVEASI